MYDDLASIEGGLAGLVAELDPAVLHGSDALVGLERVCRIAKLATTAMMLLGRRVHESDAWKPSGKASAAHVLANLSGISLGDAMTLLGTAKKLADLPKTDDAARQGKLSAKQAAEVAKGATADATAEDDLLGLAETGSTSELSAESKRLRLAAAGDDERRHARMKANRALHRFSDEDGSAILRWRHLPEVGAELDAILSDYVDDEFAVARREHRREQRCAYAADALVAALRDAAAFRRGESIDEDVDDLDLDVDELASGPDVEPDATSGGVANRIDPATTAAAADRAEGPADSCDPRDPGRPNRRTRRRAGERSPKQRRRTRRRGADAKVIVRIDHAALIRGHTEAGEICDIAGIGPVPVTSVTALMNDAFLAAVITKGRDVHTVAHLGRQPDTYQQTGLQAQGVRCAALGCPNVHRLERDHEQDWARTHRTHLVDLDWLCGHHHDLKTHHGYRLEPGTGPRALLAPDDQRARAEQPTSRTERDGGAARPEAGTPADPIPVPRRPERRHRATPAEALTLDL